MINNYLLCIEYDGSRYSGWQRQGNTDNTIESKLSECLRQMCNSGVDIEIHGSGRTDAEPGRGYQRSERLCGRPEHPQWQHIRLPPLPQCLPYRPDPRGKRGQVH